jgi:hypothetical protein
MRYAIDKKPVMYNSISVSENELKSYNDKYDLEVKGQNSHLYIAGESHQEHEN